MVESVFGASKLLGGLKRGPKFESHIVRLGIKAVGGTISRNGHKQPSRRVI